MPADVNPTPTDDVDGVTTHELPTVGKMLNTRLPFCGRAPFVVPNGSVVVLAIAIPVSKPLAETANGISMIVCAAVMLITVNGGDGSGLLA